jgi:hypothetical protein
MKELTPQGFKILVGVYIPANSMKKILLLGLLATVSLASCARRNCPAYSNTKVEVPENNK